MEYLIADGVELAVAERVSKLTGAILWPSAKKPYLSEVGKKKFPDNISILVGDLTTEKMAELLKLPVKNIIDANAMNRSIVHFLAQEERRKLTKNLGVLLSSRVVYQMNAAHIFTTALKKRVDLTNEVTADVHIALHEAMVNGLTHGNLKLSSSMRQSSKDLAKFMKTLSKRLKDPSFARKSIAIIATWNAEKLEIIIKDEGMGYEIENALKKKQPNACAKSGRGLRMIAGMADSCTIEDFGREMKMAFLLTEKSRFRASEVGGETDILSMAPDLSQSHVLVVEDERSNQILLGRFLNIIGITDIAFAADGVEALNKVAARKPDMIILDLTMPHMDGYEVLNRLKSTSETNDIPVLIQTASDTRETRDQTFKMGATDFLIKPLNPLEFFARVKVHLENRMLVKNLKDRLKQIDQDLIQAQKMQVQLLPTEEILKKMRKQYQLDIAYYFQPSARLGGDFWQLIPISRTKVGIYTCDFSGHGVSASLNTFRLHAIVASLMGHKSTYRPAEFLKNLNEYFVDLLPRGQYATFFYAVWDSERHHMTYAGAGATSPIVRRNRKKMILKTSGLPLGISKNAEYDNHELDLEPDDSMLLFSDALIESPNEKGVWLGDANLARMVFKALAAPTAREGIEEIMRKVMAYVKQPMQDDATAIFIRGK